MRAELRAELTELEARLSHSRGPIASDPPPTTQVSKKTFCTLLLVNYVIDVSIYMFFFLSF